MNTQDLEMTPEEEQEQALPVADEPTQAEAPAEPAEESQDEAAAEAEAQDGDEAEEAPLDEEAVKRVVFRKFVEAQRLMRAMHRLTTQGGPLAEALRARGRVLSLLTLKDGIATHEMAKILGIDKSTLGEALNRLAKNGYVEVATLNDEKHTKVVNLTDEGRTARIHENLSDCLFEGFEEAELENFGDFLDRIVGNINDELGDDAEKLLEEQAAAQKPAFDRDDRGGRGRDDRGGRGFGGDRGGRGRDDRGGRGRDDRGGRGFGGDRGGRGRDDRGGRGGFGGRGRDDRGGRGRDDRGGRGFGGDRGGRGRNDRW